MSEVRIYLCSRAQGSVCVISDVIHQLPLLTERQYIGAIHSRLQDSQAWKLPGLQATVRLAWALTLRGVSQLSDVTGRRGGWDTGEHRILSHGITSLSIGTLAKVVLDDLL